MAGVMMILRTFLSLRHASALEECMGLLDQEVEDPFLDERMVRIRAQLTAALALQKKLESMGYPVDQEMELSSLVNLSQEQELMTRKEAKILMQINKEANEAKHRLVFLPRA